MVDPQKAAVLLVCYRAEFGHLRQTSRVLCHAHLAFILNYHPFIIIIVIIIIIIIMDLHSAVLQ